MAKASFKLSDGERSTAARSAIGAVSLSLLLCVHVDAAQAAIEVRMNGSGVVFVSRPEQKPGFESRSTTKSPSGFSPFAISPVFSGADRRMMQDLVTEVSRRHAMDPGLVASVIRVESGFNPLAVSPKGAQGLMQLMPETARQYGVRDPHDPRQNVEGGVAYLRDLTERYHGDMALALAAYNAGPAAVERAEGVPDYRETRAYLKRIEGLYGRDLGPSSPGGSAAGASYGGPVRASRDSDGNLVITNKATYGTRVIRRLRKVRP